MADGSTIAEQIAGIAASKAAIAAAIEAKGVTVPEGAKLADLAALVANISGGGNIFESPDFWGKTPNEVIQAGLFKGIPEGITKIRDGIFFGCNELSGELVIPEGVTKIGDYAFYDSNIVKLTLPTTINTIGDYAFLHRNYGVYIINLSIFDFKYLRYIGAHAFSAALSAETLTFRSGRLLSIGDYAFAYNDNLKHVTFESNVDVIGISPFNGSINLETITFNNVPYEMQDIAGEIHNRFEVRFPNVTMADVKAHKDFPFGLMLTGYMDKITCSDGTIITVE